jgi:hypothetical protein
MGLDYSFLYVAPRAAATSLLRAVAARASKPYSRRLRAALPFAPETPAQADCGIRGLPPFQVGESRFPNDYDLVLLYPLDEELERYLGTSKDGRLEAGKAKVGLIYMKLFAGPARVLLELTAATTNMSVMLACSANARRVMTSLARWGGA